MGTVGLCLGNVFVWGVGRHLWEGGVAGEAPSPGGPEHGSVHGKAQHHKHRGANARFQPEGGALQISLCHVRVHGHGGELDEDVPVGRGGRVAGVGLRRRHLVLAAEEIGRAHV